MKLVGIIKKLERYQKRYFQKYGFDPVIYSLDDQEITLCKKIVKHPNFGYTADLPMHIKDNKLLRDLGNWEIDK